MDDGEGSGRIERFIDLSHAVEGGMITYRGLPAPVICDFLSREDSRSHYAEGTEFQIGRIEMVGYTGTYLDSPFHRFESADAANHLVREGATLVGIDSLNIDDTADGRRPVHNTLLGANIPIVEHLRGLDQLPITGFRLSAVPVKVRGFGTFPVRAYARLD